MKKTVVRVVIAVLAAVAILVCALLIYSARYQNGMKATDVVSGFYTYDDTVTTGTTVVADYMHSIGIDGAVTECDATNDTGDIPEIVLKNNDPVYYVIMSGENCYVAVIREDGSVDYEQEY